MVPGAKHQWRLFWSFWCQFVSVQSMHKESKLLPTNTTSLNSTAIDGPKHLTRPSAESSNSLLLRSSSVTVPKRSVARAWKRGPHRWDATFTLEFSKPEQTTTAVWALKIHWNYFANLRISTDQTWGVNASAAETTSRLAPRTSSTCSWAFMSVRYLTKQPVDKRYTKDTNKL